jgi:Trk-type K+ transport system membrane component
VNVAAVAAVVAIAPVFLVKVVAAVHLRSHRHLLVFQQITVFQSAAAEMGLSMGQTGQTAQTLHFQPLQARVVGLAQAITSLRQIPAALAVVGRTAT